jgi:hypothetical protein
VKTVRILLLVLLAMLLPFRGALAEVAHCTGTPNEQLQVGVTDHGHAHDADRDQADHERDHDHDNHDHSLSVADECNFCTASCSTTASLSAQPDLAAPMVLAAATFPALNAPPPSHISEGQERPPRSI